MVLDHVADGPSLIVEAAPALYAEVLRQRDLDALDVVAVPKRFHESVGKPESQDVVHGSLPQIVVNTEDVAFVEGPKQNLIQFLRRRQIVPEGLLHDDPGPSSAVGFRQMFDNSFKQSRRNCQVMRRALRLLEFLAKRSEGCRILVIAVYVA